MRRRGRPARGGSSQPRSQKKGNTENQYQGWAISICTYKYTHAHTQMYTKGRLPARGESSQPTNQKKKKHGESISWVTISICTYTYTHAHLYVIREDCLREECRRNLKKGETLRNQIMSAHIYIYAHINPPTHIYIYAYIYYRGRLPANGGSLAPRDINTEHEKG